MHILRTLLLAALLLAPAIPLCAQTAGYRLPENVSFETAEDCRRNKPEFIRVTDYLFSAPIDAPDNKAASAVAMVWIVNTEDVTIKMNSDVIMDVIGKSGLMIHYVAAWARYVLETGDTSDLAGNIAGAKAVVKYYKDRTHNVPADKRLDAYVKLEADGKLEAKIAGLMKESKGD